jgi:hypothetical protein
VLAWRQRKLLPRGLPTPPLAVAVAVAALLPYWLLRLTLQWGLGIPSFPVAG